ncbi:MAG: quinone-dependent dihydroorotate dehydrogenase [Saprospiraceae bacterium]|nr:quinone-dependent dihydroorotate dehydrogenase [Saprospiraceae bacterium]
MRAPRAVLDEHVLKNHIQKVEKPVKSLQPAILLRPFSHQPVLPVYALFKPVLFLFSPEKAHRITVALLDLAAAIPPVNWLMRRLFCVENPALARQLMGLSFPNPVGLAAGFDKDGKHIEGLACLGFGFVEVGTVTPVAQDGNPQPRLFRLPADHALVNRMGFNNEGLKALAARLKALREKKSPLSVLIGGNIGKNKITPNEAAENDYLRCFEVLFPWVDYFVVNVSSPNTPNLRALQEKEPLTKLLSLLQEKNLAQENPKPILLKIAPDLSEEQIADVADIVRATGLAGVIATNTTIARAGLKTPTAMLENIGAGGLSGAPLQARSTDVIRLLRSKLGGGFVIIGVGGIDSADSAREKMEAGADLVQVYSGLVYEGPGLVGRILRGI